MYLEIHQLSKKFGNTPVLENIQFYAEQGEFITLLGPSGCGKSTLLRCIAGLEQPSGGTIIINRQEIQDLPPQQRQMGMVFQNYALFPNMSALDNILFGLKIAKVPTEERLERAKKIIDLVELNGREHFYPDELSGGQKQRVALARSLVMNPRILLLDEPFSALDAKIRKNLRAQVREIQKELNLTTIFVTHDQQEALMISDKILLMYRGKIEQQGDAQSIYTAPVSTFAAGFIGNYNVIAREHAQQIFHQDSALAIRPEAITLLEHADTDAFSGKVIDVTLQGNVISYTIKCQTLTLAVEHLNTGKINHQVGDTVYLSIAPEAILMLQDSAA